ncbi:MAG TPA: hypothetical protein VIQ25_01225 [Gemmatimonadales bacterium]
MLVEDLAHQLLQQILQRRDAERAAELVEHDGEVAALALHVEQQVAAGPAGRRDRHRTHRQRVAGAELEQIERVEHAHDLVEGAAVDRDPAVAALGEDHPDVGEVGVLLDRHQIGARRHDLAHRADAEGHHPAHHHQLVVGPETDGRTLAPDRAQIGGTARRPRREHQSEDPRPRPQHGHHPVGDALGSRQREPAGHQIRRQQHQRHSHQREHHDQAAGPRAREKGRQRGAEDEDAERSRGRGGGELRVHLGQPPERRCRTPEPSADDPGELGPAHRDQGGPGGRAEGGDQESERDRQPDHASPPFRSGAPTGTTSAMRWIATRRTRRRMTCSTRRR